MKLTIFIKREPNDTPMPMSFELVGEYSKFYVLNNGKYNFCALKSDVKRGEAVYM